MPLRIRSCTNFLHNRRLSYPSGAAAAENLHFRRFAPSHTGIFSPRFGK
jgi:hypothetical protein